MRGKSKRWGQVAEMARRANGAWRLHPDLASVRPSLAEHARLRVRQLQPTPEGSFEFLRRNRSLDDLDRPIFDLYVRFVTSTGE